MSPAIFAWRSRLWWLVPLLALGVLLGIELGWGRQVHRLPDPAPVVEAKPVTPALLPEYKVDGGLAAHVETVNRTLFNPTRRPAPVAVADAGRPQIKTGQFILTGTSLAGDRSIAFLKEIAGGKFRTVRQGEQINGMLVAEVKPDRVRLTLGGDSEELVLKVAAGPKTTAAPAAPAPPNAAQAGQAPQREEGARLIEQRRRAAAAATANEVTPVEQAPTRSQLIDALPPAGQPAPPSPGQGTATSAAGQAAPASSDPGWNEVYERMRQRAQPSK